MVLASLAWNVQSLYPLAGMQTSAISFVAREQQRK